MPIFTIGAAGTTSSSYEIANSLRLNSGDSAQMNRTLGTATNVDKYTISMWVKRAKLSDRQMMMRVINPSSTSTYAFLEFQSDDKIGTNDYDGSGSIAKVTNRVFRDTSAWYHIVLALDSTQSTASDRSKLYINGVLETSFSTDSGGSQNQNLMGNTSGKNIYIGGDGGQNARYCGLYMAEVCFIDGQQLAADQFGEFDSDTNIWKPIDVSGLTFGNNGFHLDFEKNALTTAFVDEGHNSLTVTPSGDAQHSFEQAKINESSIKFDGTGDEITTSTNADFNLGTSDYTIEFWLYKSATMTNQSVGHTSVSNSEGHGFQIEYTSNKLGLYIWDLNNDWTFYNYEDSEASTGTWVHYAWVRNGTSFVLYKNGTAQSATTTSSASITPTTNSWAFGGHRNDSSRFFNGFMDQIRISDTARYTSNFTAPTSEMTSDSNTLLLIQSKASNFIGADVSGTGNHLTEVNIAATDQSTDTCTNNFATIDPLNTYASNPPFLTEGNLQCRTVNADPGYFGGSGTIGVSTGKWYFEVKPITTTSGNPFFVGVSHDPAEMARQGATPSAQYLAPTFLYYGHNGNKFNNGSNSSYGNSYTTNDIIGVALDLDNNKIYFSKNGTYQNSGDPTSGSTGTGSAFDLTAGETYFPVLSDGGGGVVTFQLNFGSPPYTISSGNSDANGHGNFEYAVPSGYYALNTKNLAEFG